MERWKTIMPENDEKLGHPVPNLYLPDPEKLISMKVERKDKNKPNIPIKLKNDPHELWFKQDDTFD